MPSKIVHLSDGAVKRLDAIRRRRRASYSEAVLWLAERSKLIPEYQKKEKRWVLPEAVPEQGATR